MKIFGPKRDDQTGKWRRVHNGELHGKLNIIIIVHRCGPGGSMRTCHAAGPGSIPGRDKFPG